MISCFFQLGGYATASQRLCWQILDMSCKNLLQVVRKLFKSKGRLIFCISGTAGIILASRHPLCIFVVFKRHFSFSSIAFLLPFLPYL